MPIPNSTAARSSLQRASGKAEKHARPSEAIDIGSLFVLAEIRRTVEGFGDGAALCLPDRGFGFRRFREGGLLDLRSYGAAHPGLSVPAWAGAARQGARSQRPGAMSRLRGPGAGDHRGQMGEIRSVVPVRTMKSPPASS